METKEVFSEVALFGSQNSVLNTNNSDCGCFSCDGNPCVKISEDQ